MGYIGQTLWDIPPKLWDIFGKTMGYFGLRLYVLFWDIFS